MRVLKEELKECKAQLLSKDGQITDLERDLDHSEILVKSQVRKCSQFCSRKIIFTTTELRKVTNEIYNFVLEW